MAEVERLYIEPETMGRYVTRSFLKYLAKKFHCRIGFEEISESRRERRNFKRGAFYLDVDRELIGKIRKLMKLFDVKIVDRSEAIGVFDINILMHMQTRMDTGIPIGIGLNEDRVVFAPWPSNGLTRDITVPLYISQLEENVLWIGREFKDCEDFFELIDGIPIKMIPEEKLVEFAEYLAKRTLGERAKYGILDKLISEPTDIMEDEELELMDSEEKVVSMLYKWKIINRGSPLQKGRYLIDVADLPNVAVSSLVLLGFLSGFDVIIVDRANMDFNVLNYQGRNNGFIYVSDRMTFSKHFKVYIDESKREIIKRELISGEYYTFSERFKPIWEIFKGE